MGFRPTPEIRERLELAAVKSKRSLSQEIETRLENSFSKEDARDAALGGSHVYALARVANSLIALVESIRGSRWVDDPEVARDACILVSKAFAAYSNSKELESSLLALPDTISRLLDGTAHKETGYGAEDLNRARHLIDELVAIDGNKLREQQAGSGNKKASGSPSDDVSRPASAPGRKIRMRR